MLDNEVEVLLKEYVELGEQIKKLDERKQALKDKIVAERGSKFKLGNYTVFSRTGKMLDYEYFKKVYPKVYEDCLKKDVYAVTIKEKATVESVIKGKMIRSKRG